MRMACLFRRNSKSAFDRFALAALMLFVLIATPVEAQRFLSQSVRVDDSLADTNIGVADLVSDDADLLGRTASDVVRLANARDGEGFIAVSPEARRRFWLDRARTAAISAHTNAFKINEDVVSPLEHLTLGESPTA